MSRFKRILEFYLSAGRTVIPEKNKVPVKGHKKGRKYDIEELLEYAAKGFNFGWVLGDNDLVLDVDPRNGGAKSVKTLCQKIDVKDLSIYYPTVLTGGGGFHYYMRKPRKVDAKQLKTEIKKLPGIELLHKGAKVTIVGSLHESGKRYKADRQSPFFEQCRPIKPKLLSLYLKKTGRNGTSPSKTAKTIGEAELQKYLAFLPVDEYRNHDDWYRLMMACHSATEGRGLDTFLEWSLSDPLYAGHADHIKQRWQSLRSNAGITIATLLKEVKRHGGRLTIAPDIEQDIVRALLKREFGGGKHLIHAVDQRFWFYTGTHWIVMLDNMVSSHLLDEINEFKATNPDIRKSVASLLGNCFRILRATCARDVNLTEQFKRPRSIINTKNYEIWLNESSGCFELRKHSPSSHLTYCLDVDYEPKAKCPRFNRALTEIFAKNRDRKGLIRHYWELMGYMIQNKKNIPAWILFHGSGRNGKKVLMQVPAALLGTAVSSKSITELNLTSNNHALASLPGKLAIIDDDVSSGAILPDGLLKRLTENKQLSANPKGTAEFEFTSTAIVIMAANNWPRTKDLSEGMRRRAMVFHLKRQFSDKEADLDLVDYIIENEMAGVLNKCLVGFKRLRKRGTFKIPHSCDVASQMWFSSSSQIHQFIDDMLEPVPEESLALKDEVYSAYKNWAFENGRNAKHTYTYHYFKRLLDDLKIKIKKGSGNKYFLVGYALRDD